MIIYRQKMYGAYPATWGKRLIEKAKKGDLLNTSIKKKGGKRADAMEELIQYRNSLKTADPLVNRMNGIKELESVAQNKARIGTPLSTTQINQAKKGTFNANPVNGLGNGNVKARQATSVNRNNKKWEEISDKAREDNKNWRVDRARRDQVAKYQDAQKRIAKQDRQVQSQQKSNGGFLTHVFGR